MPIGKIKGNLINLLKCKKVPLLHTRFCISHNESLPFKNFPVDEFEQESKRSFEKYNAISQTEYVIDYPDKVIIEPEVGWCINSLGKVIEESLPYTQQMNLPRPFFFKGMLPKKSVFLNNVLSIRYGGTNYYHFYNDIIGQLLFAKKYIDLKDVTIVIPERLANSKVFQFYHRHSKFLQDLSWFYQDRDTYIKSNRVVLVKNTPNLLNDIKKAAGILDLDWNALKSERRKIFLTRGASKIRSLKNHEEIEEISRSNGYEVVDTENLSMIEQIKLFYNLSHIVAIHGAGLVNLIYHPQGSYKFLELFPKSNIPPHYYWFATQAKAKYDVCLGENMTNNKFYLDPEKYRKKLMKLDTVS